MTCIATWVDSVVGQAFAVRCMQKRITVGIDATRHMARDGTWVLVVAGGLDLYLDLDPVESLTMLLTETWRCVDFEHDLTADVWTHSD